MIEAGTASEVGFQLRKGKNEVSLIGYDVIRKSLFVDRTHSGNVAFHEDFSGKHAGPMLTQNGYIHLQIFLDDSSIGVLATMEKRSCPSASSPRLTISR